MGSILALSLPLLRASLVPMRLVTRPELDGLTCAVLLSQCETVDSFEFVHPQQVRDREVDVGKDDILVCEHYLPTHPELDRYEELVRETDRLDSAQLELNDVVAPAGYVLLEFTLDSKSGLEGVQEYFLDLLPAMKTRTIQEVLDLPSVRERARRLGEQDRRYRELAIAHSTIDEGIVVTDFRSVDPLPVGNRFLIYTVFPEATVSLRIQHGRVPDTISVSVGRSIFNRNSRANVEILMSMYGGGGQAGAGACVLPAASADTQIAEIIAALKRNA